MNADRLLRQLLLAGLVGSVLSAAALYFAIFPPRIGGSATPPRADVAWTPAPARVAEPAARPQPSAAAVEPAVVHAATLPPAAEPRPLPAAAEPPAVAPAAVHGAAAPPPVQAAPEPRAAPGPTAPATVTVVELRGADAVDGATLAAGAERFRLAGLRPFAPGDLCELRRGRLAPCDEVARRTLQRLVRGRGAVVCVELGVEGGATLARCERRGRDLAEALIASGVAIPVAETATAAR
jgi:endonuclease YncB( thermonuclease family)